MKKLFILLSVLTISGGSVPTTIAASSYQKEKLNSDINYSQTSNLENLTRNKREKILSNQKIKFEGFTIFGSEYKGEIYFNTYSKKIMFSGNDSYFHRYFNGGVNTRYLQVTIFDQHGTKIKDIEIGTRDWMTKVINDYNLKNGIEYQNGYIIKIYSKEPWRTWFNIGNENNWKRFAFVDSGDWDWEWKYRIDNNNLVNYYEYNEKIKLLGIADGYRGEIGLDTNNKRIIFSGNNTWFHEYFINKNYKKIIIKNESEKIIKEIIIYGNESMQKIINDYNLEGGINYDYGYIVEIWSAEPKTTYFIMNEHNNYMYYIDSNPKLDKFILINDKLLTFSFYQKEHFDLLLEWQTNFIDWKNEINRQINEDLSTFIVAQKRSWKGDKLNFLKDKILSLKHILKTIENSENINKLKFKIEKMQNDFNILKNKLDELYNQVEGIKNSLNSRSSICSSTFSIISPIASLVSTYGTVISAITGISGAICAIAGI